jgi:hypothetical protein
VSASLSRAGVKTGSRTGFLLTRGVDFGRRQGRGGNGDCDGAIWAVSLGDDECFPLFFHLKTERIACRKPFILKYKSGEECIVMVDDCLVVGAMYTLTYACGFGVACS